MLANTTCEKKIILQRVVSWIQRENSELFSLEKQRKKDVGSCSFGQDTVRAKTPCRNVQASSHHPQLFRDQRVQGGNGVDHKFRLQHNPRGRHISPAATKIKFDFTLTLPESIANTPADSINFERGPESIIRRFTIVDLQNRVIKDIDQYNLLYAMTELSTADPSIRERRGCFDMEGWPFQADLGGWIKHPSSGFRTV